MNNIAFPICIVATKDIFRVLPGILSERKVDTILVGIANHMDGRVSEHAIKTRDFIKKLTSIVPKTIAFIEWDERLTSLEAKLSMERAGGNNPRELIDDMAASILLQSYLDAQK